MQVEWTEWVLSAAERQKFDNWMAGIMQGHTSTRDVRHQRLAWTPLTRPLSARSDLSKIARARLRDAEVLYRSRRYDGAIYLCGYATV